MRIFITIALLVAVTFAGAFAKTYILKNGTTVTGKIISTNGNNIILEDERGKNQIVPKDQFSDIGGVISNANEENRQIYRFMAIGVNLIDTFWGRSFIDTPATVISTMTEIALFRFLALQIDLACVPGATNGFQLGGGLRFYFWGQGVQGLWLGAYGDFLTMGFGSGWELGALVGYKIAFWFLQIDPFIGIRSSNFSYFPDGLGGAPVIYTPFGLKYGVNIGVAF